MLFQANGISKSYGVKSVLSNISIQVLERERIGLVGVNGAGKSTFLKIIAGEMSHDRGDIFKSKETRIGYLAQNSGLQSDRTIWNEMLQVFSEVIAVEKELRELEIQMADPKILSNEKEYENVLHRYAIRSEWFKAQGGYEMEARIRGVLHGMGFAEFPADTVINTLSGGQKTRLALARILLQSPDVLMLDEPTNYLDIPTLTWLEGYLRSYPGAILVVSHDRYFLDALVDTIYEIERHQSKRYTGNYSRYTELKAAEYEIQMKMFEKQQDEISKMEDFVQKNIVRASTTKRAQSRRKALEKMDRLDKPLGDLKKASFSFEVEQTTGQDVLKVADVAVSFDGTRRLFEHVTFDLSRGETVALIGPNGIGKSTLLKTLVGQREPDSGTFRWGSNVKIGYYDQEQTGLNGNNTVLEEVWGTYPHLEESRIRTVLGNFLFSGEDVLKKVSALSGGEKARVSLAKLMLLRANVLILDEPTNHLDLYSKEVLEASLMDFDGTLLFISHDRYFLNKMAERIVELTPSGTQHFLGNYDEYLEKLQEIEDLKQEQLQKTANGKSAQGQSAKGGKVESHGEISGSTSYGTSSSNKPTGAGKNANGEIISKHNGKEQVYELNKEAKREERSRQRRLEQLEQDIARLEGDIGGIESELAKPEVYNDYMQVQEKTSALEQSKQALEQVYAEWELLVE